MHKLKPEDMGRPSPMVFSKQQKAPIVLVLDNVRSALNVGSAFRTADAFSLERIFLCGITATPPHREILKTALGATQTVPWEYSEDAGDVLRGLKKQGFVLLAAEQTTESTYLHEFSGETGKHYALVFGNEVEGVGAHTLSFVDGALEIPQFGTKHSLNVSVAIGIITWEIFKQTQLLAKGAA